MNQLFSYVCAFLIIIGTHSCDVSTLTPLPSTSNPLKLGTIPGVSAGEYSYDDGVSCPASYLITGSVAIGTANNDNFYVMVLDETNYQRFRSGTSYSKIMQLPSTTGYATCFSIGTYAFGVQTIYLVTHCSNTLMACGIWKYRQDLLSCTPDACANVNCGSHGTCSDGACNCKDGFTGIYCTTPPDPCATINCGSHGTCSAGTCNCKDGFTGPDCTTLPGDPCTICGPHTSSCTDSKCVCADLYTGTDCTVAPAPTCNGFDSNSCAMLFPSYSSFMSSKTCINGKCVQYGQCSDGYNTKLYCVDTDSSGDSGQCCAIVPDGNTNSGQKIAGATVAGVAAVLFSGIGVSLF